MGAHICCIYEDEEERQKFLSVITDAQWGSRLGKLGVSKQRPNAVEHVCVPSPLAGQAFDVIFFFFLVVGVHSVCVQAVS